MTFCSFLPRFFTFSLVYRRKKHTFVWWTNVCFFQLNPPLAEEIHLRRMKSLRDEICFMAGLFLYEPCCLQQLARFFCFFVFCYHFAKRLKCIGKTSYGVYYSALYGSSSSGRIISSFIFFRFCQANNQLIRQNNLQIL